jgi:polysaccharide biosynthesis protein PslJ
VVPTNLPLELDQLDNIGRLTVDGPTSEPLELAALLAMVIPFAVIGAADATTRRRRVMYIVAATILLAGSIATQRKTSVVASLVGLLVLVAYRPRLIRALLVAAVPVFAVVHFIAPGQIGSLLAQLLPGHATTVTTTTDRVARYDAVRPDVMSHFLFGRGYQSYDPLKYRILDNEYLGLLIGVGVIGLAVYLAIFSGLIKVAHPTIRGPDRSRAAAGLPLMAALAVVIVSNALFDVLSFPHVSYLFFFIAAMLLVLRQRSPEAPEQAGLAGGSESGYLRGIPEDYGPTPAGVEELEPSTF